VELHQGDLGTIKTTKDVHFCTLLRSSSVSKIDEFRLSTRMRSGASVILWQIGLPQKNGTALTGLCHFIGAKRPRATSWGRVARRKLNYNDVNSQVCSKLHSLENAGAVDANTLEETDKRNGKIVATARITVSADGKKTTYVSHDKERDRTSTFVLNKK
jgi:hypothetical protein